MLYFDRNLPSLKTLSNDQLLKTLYAIYLKLRRISSCTSLKGQSPACLGLPEVVTVVKIGSSNDASVGKRRNNNSGLDTTGFAGLWTFPVDLGGLRGRRSALST